jgi:hypothetical protein
MNDALIRAVPDMVSPLEPPRWSGAEPRAAAGGENEKIAEPPLEIPTGDSDPDVGLVKDGENDAVPIGDGNPDVVLVDYEENDPENPLNWSPTRKWLMVLAISWMGFVRLASFVLFLLATLSALYVRARRLTASASLRP